VAFPPNAVISNDILDGAMDLLLLFGNSIARIINVLRHRFHDLPIHKLVYYHSYYQGVMPNLIAAINMRSGQRRTLRSKLDQTGNLQDCLGMTPLHILTCSSAHDLAMYCVIVDNYPSNLTTEDRWGATPMLYAFWGNAPAEIIHFLLDSYLSLYPSHVFNWTMMMETMGRCDTPKERIQNLLHVRQMHFPAQPLNWEYLLEKFAESSDCSSSGGQFDERMQFLFMCGMSSCVDALAFKVWRDHITDMIHTANYHYNRDNSDILHEIQAKVAHFEDEYPKLKEITTILELAVWKLKMNDNIPQEERCRKKMKTNESSIRRQCRITCGADIVIQHILPYLITATDEESDSETDTNDVDDNESIDSE
jgi:hypothetical protein